MPALSCSDRLVSQLAECIPTLLWQTVDGHAISSESDLDNELVCKRLNQVVAPNLARYLSLEDQIWVAIGGNERLLGGDCP